MQPSPHVTILPEGSVLSDWTLWSKQSVAQAIAAGALDLHVDFQNRSPIDIRAIAVVQDLVRTWDCGLDRHVRLENIAPAVHKGLAFLGMCDAPEWNLPITASVDAIGVVRIVPMDGIEDIALDQGIARDWLDGLVVDEVRIDMRHIDQMGSHFISWLLDMQSRIPSVELYKVTTRVEHVLRDMRLDKLFPIRRKTAIILAG